MRTKTCMLLGLMILLAHTAYAELSFDDFDATISDDEINVGEKFSILLFFDEPDDSTSADLDIEIEVDGVVVFKDEDYRVSFSEGEDKSINLSSDDFPGPDLDYDYFNDNLMNYVCGEVDVVVTVGGGDLDEEYEAEDRLSIGDSDEELSFELEPDDPKPSDDVVVTVLNEDDDEMDGATVKITWVSDPSGGVDDEWDSEDDSWDDETNDDGEVEFNLADEFGDTAGGGFQIDVYAEGYCLERDVLNITEGQLKVEITPAEPVIGDSIKVCVTSSGDPVVAASVFVRGPNYSKTQKSPVNGCITLALTSLGEYRVSATKSGFVESLDTPFTIRDKATSTTTTVATTTTKATTTSTTLKTPTEQLSLNVPKLTYSIGDIISVDVKDLRGNPLSGIDMKVTPSDISGRTDSEGVFSFTLDAPGRYTIYAASESQTYAKFSQTIEVVSQQASTTRPIEGGGSSDNLVWILLFGALGVGLILVVVALVILVKKSKPKEGRRERSYRGRDSGGDRGMSLIGRSDD